MTDAFADSHEYKYGKPEFKKNEYIQLAQGPNIIRILEPKSKKEIVHYINRGYVKCLEEQCPICANNRNLIRDYPETFRKEKSYSAAIARYYVNVLDRTPVKICGACGKEHKDLTKLKCECGGLLPVDAQPLNRIRILAKGTSLFVEQLNVIQNAILTPEGEPMGITSFDINLFVKGEGRDTRITAIADPTKNDVIEFNPLDLFDIENLVMELTPEEMLEVQSGVSYKDIFANRRVTKDAESKERQEGVDNSVENLFSN